MKKTSVHTHFEEYKELLKTIPIPEVSLRTSIFNNYRKSLILVSASYFEKNLNKKLLTLISKRSKSSEILQRFLENQALNRKYHTLFDWDKLNANRFFKLFGNEFASFMTRKIRNDEKLEKGIKSFMEIGQLRNSMLHDDYGSFQIEKNPEEVFTSFLEAQYFLHSLPILFKEFLKHSGRSSLS